MKEAAESGASKLSVLTAWRAFSGAAHGRSWVNLSLLKREETGTPDGDVAHFQLTNDLEKVLWAVTGACDLTRAALNLYRLRAVRHH